MTHKTKKIITLSLLSLAALLVVTGGVIGYWVFAPMFPKGGVKYLYIRPGDTREQIMAKIDSTAHPHSLTGFRLLSAVDRRERRISGRYAIEEGDNMITLYKRLAARRQTPVKVVIPSVRTLDKLAASIASQLMLDSTSLMNLWVSPAYLNRMDLTPETLPTLFIPNTYEFYWDTDINHFMARILKEHKKFWKGEREKEAQEIGLTPAEVFTLASIIDEETNNKEEKSVIAGVYMNRLHKGMLLQSCPTVKFALHDFAKQRVEGADLEVVSPYNTYLNKGLPPGPIRIPSIAAIESVLHYTRHNYLYMCAKEDFSGTHNFAETGAQHMANARRYRQALDKRNIK